MCWEWKAGADSSCGRLLPPCICGAPSESHESCDIIPSGDQVLKSWKAHLTRPRPRRRHLDCLGAPRPPPVYHPDPLPPSRCPQKRHSLRSLRLFHSTAGRKKNATSASVRNSFSLSGPRGNSGTGKYSQARHTQRAAKMEKQTLDLFIIQLDLSVNFDI